MSVYITSNTGQFKDQHRAALVKTMEDIGSAIEAELQERLNEAWPPASLPGESPHRRTGLLRAGAGHQTDESEAGVTETIYSSRGGGDPNVPTYLEFGVQGRANYAVRLGRRADIDRGSRSGGMAARPFMQPVRDAWNEVLFYELRDGIRANVGINDWVYSL